MWHGVLVSRQGLLYPSLTLYLYVVENDLTSSMEVPCLPYNVVFLTLYNFLSSYSQKNGVCVNDKKNVLGANALAVSQIIK